MIGDVEYFYADIQLYAHLRQIRRHILTYQYTKQVSLICRVIDVSLQAEALAWQNRMFRRTGEFNIFRLADQK